MKELKLMEKKKEIGGYTIIALTPGAELHNIGLKMITDVLELKGYNVIYLGSNVPVQSLLDAIKNCFWQSQPKIVIDGYAFENYKKALEVTDTDYYGLDTNDIIEILD